MKITNRIVSVALFGLLATAGCDDDDGIMPDGGGSGGTDAGAPDGGMMTGQARGASNPPTLGAQIDRAGRAAISTALIGTFMSDPVAKEAVKESYNRALPATWPTFVPEIRKNLAILDALDTVCGNQIAFGALASPGYNTLAGVLADDRLYLNTGSSKCGVYLGLEAELVVPGLPAAAKGSCGGRTPTDDVVSRSYTVLAGVPADLNLDAIDDTVTKDADATLDLNTFPWLGAPKP